MIFFSILCFANSIDYQYVFNNLTLLIKFTQNGDQINQKAVNAEAPISEMENTIIFDGIESINERSFLGYSKLKSITFGHGIKAIKNNAFEGCSSLRSINLPDTLESLSKEVFFKCYALRNITIPRSLISMTSDVFREAYSLSYFFIPFGNDIYSVSDDNTILIKDNTTAFVGPGAFPTIQIPENVKHIESFFLYGRGVSKIKFGTSKKLQSISNCAFSYSSISEIEFPEGVLTLSDNIFEGNSVKIERMVIPSSPTYIGNINFNIVKEIIIHENCTALHKGPGGMLYNGDWTKILLFPLNLEEYVVPEKITSLPLWSLITSPNLTKINVTQGNSVYSDYKNSIYNADKSIFLSCVGGTDTVYVHSNCHTIGQGAMSHGGLKHVFFEGSSVRTIMLQAFQLIECMERFDIPEGVTIISDWSFYQNRTPIITFPSTLTTILGKSFIEASLREADFSNCSEIKEFPLNSFYRCDKIEVLKLPPNLEKISQAAFSGCSSLRELVVTPKIHTLESSCFANCQSLRTLIIRSEVPLTINSKAFQNCGLENIEFGLGTSVIYQNAFSDNPNLKEIKFSDDCALSEIQTEAFTNCQNIQKVRLGKNVSKIYPGAFSEMYALRSIEASSEYFRSIDGVLYTSDEETLVTFPGGLTECRVSEGVRFIGEKAFYKCKNLAKLEIAVDSALEEIKGFTFAGCDGLNSVQLPPNLAVIEESGFQGCSGLANVTFRGESKLSVLKSNVFAGCTMIQSVLFEANASLSEIESRVFRDCARLAIFMCPPSLRVIGSEAFKGCLSLKDINFTHIEEFGQSSFEGCALIRSVAFSPNLKTLAKDSFRGCGSLDAVSYCGSGVFKEESFGGVGALIRVRISYEEDTFGGVRVWHVFDDDCRMGTLLFTSRPSSVPSFSFLGIISISENDSNTAKSHVAL